MSAAPAQGRIVQLDGRSKVYRPLPADARAAAVLDGLRRYAAGDAFEAHEAWEPAWMGTDDLGERALLQGLIKLAAADVHGQRGNPAGVARNLVGALQRLRAAASAGTSTAPGAVFDLPTLIEAADARLHATARGETGPSIPIPWRPA